MKKIMAALLSIWVLFLSIPLHETSLASGKTTGEITKAVNFRKTPDVADNQIRYLRTGESVTIIDKVNSYWYKVKDQNGISGYVSTSSRHIDSTWKPLKVAHTSVIVQQVIDAGMKYLRTPYGFEKASGLRTQTR